MPRASILVQGAKILDMGEFISPISSQIKGPLAGAQHRLGIKKKWVWPPGREPLQSNHEVTNMDDLTTLRAEIDEIDAQLTSLFLRRMDVTRRVGAYKQSQGIPVLDAAREQEVLAKKAALVSDPALKSDVTALFEAIMGISRRQQRRQVSEAAGEG